MENDKTDKKSNLMNPLGGIAIMILGLFSGRLEMVFIGIGLAIIALLWNILKSQNK
ncbi:MAG: hypothetical protein Q8O64_14035 [Sideroxyarcus sp.]|nr:hypothetical protein [Sideroxyarcus sp.]